MRFALQAVAAAVVSLAVPVVGALWVLSAAPAVSADGSIDDAPERAAMLFLIGSPAVVAALATFFAGTAALLRYLGHLSLHRLLGVNLGVALAVAVALARQGYRAFGAHDAVISFAVFGALVFASLAFGSTAWWLLRPASGGG